LLGAVEDGVLNELQAAAVMAEAREFGFSV
jgi:hypothetical protein